MGSLVANYVITEVTSGANQGTLVSLFKMVHSLGEPLGRAIAESLYGTLCPALAEAANYIDDAPEFRRVVVIAAFIAAGFASTIVFFICLLPDSKEETHDGMRAAVRRPWLLYFI